MVAMRLIIILVAFKFAEGQGSDSTDEVSLLAFKDFVTSDSFHVLSSWKRGTNCCFWYGVRCDPFSGRIFHLNITGSRFSVSNGNYSTGGTSWITGIIAPAIGNLANLRFLSLPHNSISGAMPSELGNLARLEILKLQGNNLSGSIPPQIIYLKSLRILNLSMNMFSGSIPAKLIRYGILEAIDLSRNQLSGKFEVDEDAKCDFLKHLNLSGNFMTNNIPQELGKCWRLKILAVAGNIFEGRIPPEIGRLTDLEIHDVSRNSLTDRIPKEMMNCGNLRVLILTDLIDWNSEPCKLEYCGGEFNAFEGSDPWEVFLVPKLQILWAPRANLGGWFSGGWNASCSLRILNLAQNYLQGEVPESLGLCKNLIYLDLSSNGLIGHLLPDLMIPCMLYFNISRNSLTGVLPAFRKGFCSSPSTGRYEVYSIYRNSYIIQGSVMHDFIWNKLYGSLPAFFLQTRGSSVSYVLALNNNLFSGSVPGELVSHCNDLRSLSVNLSSNLFDGTLNRIFPVDCSNLKELEAAENKITGPIGSGIRKFEMLEVLDLIKNTISGPLPIQLGQMKNLRWVLLGDNKIDGEIPRVICQIPDLIVLDLSRNFMRGTIPTSLGNNNRMETLLLDHNRLSGDIPPSFLFLFNLTRLNVSYNNLSGIIPRLRNRISCDCFSGNRYLIFSCVDQYPSSEYSSALYSKARRRNKLMSFPVVMVTLCSLVFIAVVILVLVLKRKKVDSMRWRRTLVTFSDALAELNYGNMVKATGNFSIKHLIGTGGFGSTYKAELLSGFVVAVKRLSIGKFQGIQQFDAEIRTLGRIRHRNIVTLIGYYIGDAEMLLIYNYLPGGNLETFIHQIPGGKNRWCWFVFLKIAMDVAQALVYLHYSCEPRIVHRDIKPSNILLDEEWNDYLFDFGLARLLEVSETHVTTGVAGTFGYVAPEYATTCRGSEKADVYSFGVVLLEMASGKRCVDPSLFEYGNGFNIVAWANLMMEEGRVREVFFPELWETSGSESLVGLLRLASVCTMEAHSVRPSMKQVVERLRQLNR